MILKADEVVAVGAEVLLAELHDGVGPLACFGVGQAGGLHGAEAEGVAAAAGGLFNGEAAFEVFEFFGDAWRRSCRRSGGRPGAKAPTCGGSVQGAKAPC